MHILVTNDHGVRASGLQALARALRPLGELTILALDWNWPASGHVKIMHRPLRVREVRLDDGNAALATEGVLLNINVPYGPKASMRGVAITWQGLRVYRDALVQREDPRGSPLLLDWRGGPQRIAAASCRLLGFARKLCLGHPSSARPHRNRSDRNAQAMGAHVLISCF